MPHVARAAVAVVVGVAVAAGIGAGVPRGEAASASAALDDIQVRVLANNAGHVFGPDQFCAAPNGEPVSLACGVARRRSHRLLTPRPLRQIRLVFGADAGSVFVTWQRVSRRGTIALGYPTPLRYEPGSKDHPDPRHWTVPLGSAPRETDAFELLVRYDAPVTLRLPGRRSTPFTDATSTYAFRLAVPTAHRRTRNP